MFKKHIVNKIFDKCKNKDLIIEKYFISFDDEHFRFNLNYNPGLDLFLLRRLVKRHNHEEKLLTFQQELKELLNAA